MERLGGALCAISPRGPRRSVLSQIPRLKLCVCFVFGFSGASPVCFAPSIALFGYVRLPPLDSPRDDEDCRFQLIEGQSEKRQRFERKLIDTDSRKLAHGVPYLKPYSTLSNGK